MRISCMTATSGELTAGNHSSVSKRNWKRGRSCVKIIPFLMFLFALFVLLCFFFWHNGKERYLFVVLVLVLVLVFVLLLHCHHRLLFFLFIFLSCYQSCYQSISHILLIHVKVKARILTYRKNYSEYWNKFWDYRYGNCYTFNGGVDDDHNNQTVLETHNTGPSGGKES